MRFPCKCPQETYGREHESDVPMDQILACDNSIPYVKLREDNCFH